MNSVTGKRNPLETGLVGVQDLVSEIYQVYGGEVSSAGVLGSSVAVENKLVGWNLYVLVRYLCMIGEIGPRFLVNARV